MEQGITCQKPWGEYTDFFRSPECTMKVLIIKEGEQISYQKHERRGEFWFITQGNPVLKLSVSPDNPLVEFTQSVLTEKSTIEIPAHWWHQLTAPEGGGDVIICEMQFGECSEDDIERVDDQYEKTVHR